jgi:uncharacterized membrane protein YtjA (UPF0391 family)
MKKYTIHFLILTIVTTLLGFTGLEFTGDSFIRFVCLVSFIGLMISCLDAVLLTRNRRRISKEARTEKVRVKN